MRVLVYNNCTLTRVKCQRKTFQPFDIEQLFSVEVIIIVVIVGTLGYHRLMSGLKLRKHHALSRSVEFIFQSVTDMITVPL